MAKGREGKDTERGGMGKKEGKGWKQKERGREGKPEKLPKTTIKKKTNFQIYGILYSPSPRSSKFGMQARTHGVLFRAKFYRDRRNVYNPTQPRKYDRFWKFWGLLYRHL